MISVRLGWAQSSLPRLPREDDPKQNPRETSRAGGREREHHSGEGPSCAEADCERVTFGWGSEGKMKQGDMRLDKKAGTRSGRVLSSRSLRQNEDSVPAAQPHLYFHNKEVPIPSCLPSKLCMYVLEWNFLEKRNIVFISVQQSLLPPKKNKAAAALL